MVSQIQAVKRENVSYIVTCAYKRPAAAGGLCQSATLRSTGNISVFLAPSLLQCQSLPISFLHAVKKEIVSYIVERSLCKRRQNRQPFSVDYTTFYRQHLCGGQCTQEQSRPQPHTWNSKLFVIFPPEITAAHSLPFQHLYVD